MSEPEADSCIRGDRGDEMFVLVKVGSEVAVRQTQVWGVLCVWRNGHKYSIIARTKFCIGYILFSFFLAH